MAETIYQPEAHTRLVADGAFSVPEACTFLGVSRASVYRMLETGQLKSVRLGRRRLVLRQSCAALLAANVTGLQG